MSGIVLTAGYDRSLHSVAIADGLRRLGYPPSLVVIAYPLTAARMRTVLRTRGFGAVLRYLRRWPDSSSDASPLREHLTSAGIAERSLREWAKRWHVRCASVGDINADTAVRLVRKVKPKVTIYTGGGILRRRFIDAAGSVLNAHSGPLPAVRGMNACEWSLLLGEPLSVTVHLIDEGIDTGAVIERIAVEAQAGDTLDILRQRCVVAGIEALVRHAVLCAKGETHNQTAVSTVSSRQCFVLAPALRELLLQHLPAIIEHQQHLTSSSP